jgi:signal peptidase II
VALGGTALDLGSKAYVFRVVGQPGQRPPKPIVAGVIEFLTSFNPGALWGWGRGLPHGSLLFAGLSAVAAVVIYWWLFVRGAAADRLLTIALGLIMAGALGNLYDRVALGHVRDFIRVHVDSIGFTWWPIFNVADCLLVTGATGLMLLALRPDPIPTDADAPAASKIEQTAPTTADLQAQASV